MQQLLDPSVKSYNRDLSGGPPAGDMGLIFPGPGRFHVQRSDYAHAPRARALWREATAVRRLCFSTQEQPQLTETRESLHAATKTLHSQN